MRRFCSSFRSSPTFLRLRHEVHGVQDLAQDDGLVLLEQAQRVLDVDDADHVVRAAVVDGDAAEAALHHETSHFLGGRRHVEGEDLGPRDHHLLDRRLRELEDAVDQLLLRLVEHALLAALLDQVLDLLLGDERAMADVA